MRRKQYMNPVEAAKILGLSGQISLDDVKKSFRKKAMAAHPDKGGTTEEFVKLREAHDSLMAYGEAALKFAQRPVPVVVWSRVACWTNASTTSATSARW